MQIDQAVAGALLAALTPAGVKAALQAAEALEQDHDAALEQWRLQVERARYQAERAERRYRQVEPEHRLVARGLERDWEKALGQLAEAEAELSLREQQRPRTLTDTEREQLLALGGDLGRVWAAPTTSDRDRKQLLRTLIDEVILDVKREQRPRDRHDPLERRRDHRARGRAPPPPAHDPHRRGHDRAAHPARRPLRRRQRSPGSSTAKAAAPPPAKGSPPRSSPACATTGRSRATSRRAEPPDGELLPVGKAADELGVAASTLHRWLQAGFIAGEQDTPGAPWRIRVNDQLRALFVEDAPAGTCRSSTRCEHSASPAKPCCNVSSAASCKPSTSATDAEKACEYWPHKRKTPCSPPPSARERQCDDGSKQLRMSASSAHTWPSLTVVLTVSSA